MYTEGKQKKVGDDCLVVWRACHQSRKIMDESIED